LARHRNAQIHVKRIKVFTKPSSKRTASAGWRMGRDVGGALYEQVDRGPPEAIPDWVGGGRGARRSRREGYGSGKIREPDRKDISEGREAGGEQGVYEIDYRCLDAALAVRAAVGILLGLVVMEESSEQADNKNGNDGKRLNRETLTNGPFWMLPVHNASK
jgi:hypothetical protein